MFSLLKKGGDGLLAHTYTRKGSFESEVSVILKDTLPPSAAAFAGASTDALHA